MYEETTTVLLITVAVTIKRRSEVELTKCYNLLVIISLLIIEGVF